MYARNLWNAHFVFKRGCFKSKTHERCMWTFILIFPFSRVANDWLKLSYTHNKYGRFHVESTQQMRSERERGIMLWFFGCHISWFTLLSRIYWHVCCFLRRNAWESHARRNKKKCITCTQVARDWTTSLDFDTNAICFILTNFLRKSVFTATRTEAE